MLKRFSAILLTVFCLSQVADARTDAPMRERDDRMRFGLGYDLMHDMFLISGQLTPQFRLEVGANLDWEIRDDEEDIFDIDLFINGLFTMHRYRAYSSHLTLGVFITDITRDDILNTNNGDVETRILLGYEPELRFWDHFSLSTHFGFLFQVTPDFRLTTHGPTDLLQSVKIRFMF